MRMRNRIALTTISGMLHFPLLAAQAQEPSNNADQASGRVTLPADIVVTARKREETLLEVPLAVSAVTGQQLYERQTIDLRGLSQSVPSLFFESQGASRNDRSINTVVVRGMPAGTTQNATGERASVFIDGAPVFGGFVQGLTDLSSVEVLRGPQSAYFGRATFSGAINLRTSAPADVFKGRIETSYASNNYTENQIVLEGPIVSGKLGVRMSGRYFSTDGQYQNAAVPGEKLGARETKSGSVTVYATPTETFTAKLFATYWADDDGPDARGLLRRLDFNCNVNNGTANNYICGQLPQIPSSRIGMNTTGDATFFSEVAANVNNRFITAVPGNFLTHYGLGRRAFHGNLVADWAFTEGALLSYVGSIDDNKYIVINDSDSTDSRDIVNSRFPATPFVKPFVDFALRADVALRSSYNELRLASTGEGRFQWVIGGSVFTGQRAGSVFGLAATGFSQFTQLAVSRVNTKGIFGSAAYDISDTLNVSLEGRYQVDRVSQRVAANTPLSATFRSFTPRAILSYRPDPRTTVYGSYARGVNPGGLNAAFFALPASVQATLQAQAGASLVVAEEKIDNYEIGFKGLTDNRRFTYAIAAYLANWSNQQLSNQFFFTNPATGATNGVTVTTSIGRTLLYGLEIETTWRPIDRLSLSANLSINENKLKQYICLSCRTQITGGSGDVAGNKLGRAPRLTGQATIGWDDDLNADWRYFLRGDYSYRGKIFVEETNLNFIKPQNLINLRAGVSNTTFRIEGFITNLLQDSAYVSAQQSTDLTRGGLAIPVGLAERRRIGARATVRF